MSGKPAARIGDSVVKGVITTGSATVLIGSQGGVACSTCPGGMAVGNPVNPSLGAKVLGGAEDLDFALPGAMGLVWQRQYSSYVNPSQGGACGLLGYGWTLPFEMSLQLNEGSTLLFDASGRTLTFPEVLPPGGYLFSNSEGLYIVRGNAGGSCEWRNEPRFAGVPATWRKDSDSLMATSGDGQMLWRFVPHTSPLWSEPRWLLHAKRDRFGREQHYSYETVHHSLFDATGRERLLEYPWPLLTRISDGCGRVFHIQYIALHAEAWDLPRVAKLHEQNSFHPFQPDTSGHQGQAGWQADSGWRVQAVEVVELDGSRHSLVHYGYSTQGDLIEVRDRYQQVVRRFAYKNHLLYAHQERQGPEHVYGYEADLPGARVLEQRNEEGLNYVFLYEAHPDAPDDPERSQTRVRDSLGREDVYEFAGQGGLKRLVRHQRPDGSILAYKYNGFGYLTGQTDAAGRTTWLPRDGQGRLLGVRSSIGPHLSLNYNEHGLLVERRLGLQSTRYIYDDWQRLVQITHPDGSTEGFAYLDLSSPSSPQDNTQTSRHSLLTAEYPRCLIDAEGGERQLEWSLTGQLLSHTDCSGHTTQYQYTPLGQIKEVRYANDHSQRYHYNSLNQLERTRHADGSGEHYQYDPRGRLIGVTPLDTLGQPLDEQSIQLDYDLWSRIIRRTHAGVSLQFAYDARGLLTELINENGANSRFEWDVMDRLSKEEGVDGRIQHYHYNPLGLLICQDDGQRDQWRSIHYAYDGKGRLALRRYGQAEAFVPQPQEQDLLLPGAPYEQRFEWDDMGRLMLARHGYGHGELMQPLSECQFEYTPAGQLAGEIQRIWLTDSNGTPQIQHEYLVQHQYDLLGNRSQSLLPELGELGLLRYGSGHLHGIALNQQSLISFQRDALHREVERRYDLYPLANPETSPLDPVELIRTQHYDPLGRLQQRSYQGLPGTENGSGEHQPLVALQQRHYHYDALGQLVRIQQPASKNGWHYSYDAQGRLHSAHNDQDPASQQRWWFDAAGNPLPPPHAKQPSPADRAETVRQRWHEPGFNVLEFAYASENAQAHYWPDNRVYFSEHERYQYDAQGNRTHSDNNQTGETKHYQYNSLNQLIQVEHHKANQTLERSRYTYDPLGRRLAKQVEYLQVTHEQSTDALHTSQSAQPQETQLTEIQPATLEYYGWDGDRLVFCNDQTHQWHYLYEPDSFTPMLLIRQDSHPELSEAKQVIAQNMDMMQSMFEQMGSEAHSLRQQMRDKLIAQLKQMGMWEEPKLPQDYYFYHCNHLGLPDVLTDKTGQVVWAAEYDPWGNLQTEHNPENLKQNIRLPGQYHDTDTGLYYNRHRYYDPKLGRYINQDPIGLNSGEPNFYAYPKNPLQGVDPLGLEVKDPVLDPAIKGYKFFDKIKNIFDLKEAYEEGEQARIKNKELSCQADEEHRKRLEEGGFEYSSELARAAKKVANASAGPVSDTVEKASDGLLGAVVYNIGYWTTWPICSVSNDS